MVVLPRLKEQAEAQHKLELERLKGKITVKS